LAFSSSVAFAIVNLLLGEVDKLYVVTLPNK